MKKFATKEMAEKAKLSLEQCGLAIPNVMIKVEYDDHGYFLETRIKGKEEFKKLGVDVPMIVDVDGFALKNCVIYIG